MAEMQRPVDLFGRVSALVGETRAVVAAQMNAALTLMNWQIGHLIGSETLGKQRAEFAEETAAMLSPLLTKRYGG
ncbi:hypothetical protein MPC38_08815 [Prescottella equi]|uniref:DUF1016 N-terminal domain-containing protein n=1 Tax=Rhodococcus hoagii TaxID=43767 RepID=UPI001F5BE083|nr:DUF1016 N-terminal domain-containing protein [Prescottella equi]UNQ41325.1 hypothetical protein MPC38_08815 [Prescottella equi]